MLLDDQDLKNDCRIAWIITYLSIFITLVVAGTIGWYCYQIFKILINKL